MVLMLLLLIGVSFVSLTQRFQTHESLLSEVWSGDKGRVLVTP